MAMRAPATVKTAILMCDIKFVLCGIGARPLLLDWRMKSQPWIGSFQKWLDFAKIEIPVKLYLLFVAISLNHKFYDVLVVLETNAGLRLPNLARSRMPHSATH